MGGGAAKSLQHITSFGAKDDDSPPPEPRYSRATAKSLCASSEWDEALWASMAKDSAGNVAHDAWVAARDGHRGGRRAAATRGSGSGSGGSGFQDARPVGRAAPRRAAGSTRGLGSGKAAASGTATPKSRGATGSTASASASASPSLSARVKPVPRGMDTASVGSWASSTTAPWVGTGSGAGARADSASASVSVRSSIASTASTGTAGDRGQGRTIARSRKGSGTATTPPLLGTLVHPASTLWPRASDATTEFTEPGTSTPASVAERVRRYKSSPLARTRVPLKLNMQHKSVATPETLELLRDIGGSDLIRSMCTRFYAKAYQDATLSRFQFRSDGAMAAGSRLGSWIAEKAGGTPMWSEARSTGGYSRQMAHNRAWHSARREPERAGRRFKLDDARVWMRIFFWAMREEGLTEHGAFAAWLADFIEHFIAVYERSAAPYTRESLEWSADPRSIDAYVAAGREMEDVIGIGVDERAVAKAMPNCH